MPRDLKCRIPDFSLPEYENLILSLQKGTCIFVGAGISKLGGYKLWDELKNEMVDYFWRNKGKLPFNKRSDLDLSLCENLKKHEDIIETFDYLYLLNSGLFISGIKYIFYVDSMKVSNKVYQILNITPIPDHDEKHIRSIVEFLYKTGAHKIANEICIIYGKRGNEILRDIYEKYNVSK